MILLAMAAVAVFALLAGCDSDTVAPHDNLPALTAEDAANQSAIVALTYKQIGPMAIQNPAKTAGAHPIAGAGFSGEVWIDWLTAEGGEDATWNTAGWVHVFTEADSPVVYTTPLGGTTEFNLDVAADIARDPTTGVISGSGSMVSGEYTLSYTILNLEVVEGADYPATGIIEVVTQGHTVSIVFDGDNTALLTVNMTDVWEVNLDTGAVTPWEVPPV